jgi:hypothetical protein
MISIRDKRISFQGDPPPALHQHAAPRMKLLYPEHLPESLLFDFMSASSQPASIKSPESEKYIFSNAANTDLMGFACQDQLIGLTVRDLNFSRSQQGNAWAEKIQRMDCLSQQKKCVVEDTDKYLNENGILSYKITTKLPLVGIRGNVLGIVTFSQDLTHRLSHRLLYEQYKQICGKKIAIQRTLRHLEIESYFHVPPTEAELLNLIQRATGKIDKDIAGAQGVSKRTIDTHFANLRAKLKGEVLRSVISHLRNPSHRIDTI